MKLDSVSGKTLGTEDIKWWLLIGAKSRSQWCLRPPPPPPHPGLMGFQPFLLNLMIHLLLIVM